MPTTDSRTDRIDQIDSSTNVNTKPQFCIHGESIIAVYQELRNKSIKSIKCSHDLCQHNATWNCLNETCKLTFCGKNGNMHHLKHYESSNHYVQMAAKSGRVWCVKCNHEVKFELTDNEEANIKEDKPLVLFSTKRIEPTESDVIAQPSSSFQNSKRVINSAISNRMNYVLIDEEENEDMYRPRGAVGLRNLGNTCYMNAAIQSLSNCPPLNEYFRFCYSNTADQILHGMVQARIHPTKPLSSAFKDIIIKLWMKDQSNSISPTGFVYRIRENCAQFRGWSQQDSQEFIRCFLDLLHNELKRPIHPREQGFCKRVNSPSANSNEAPSISSSRSSSSNGDLNENDQFETADSGLSSDTDEGAKDKDDKKDERNKKTVKYRSIVSETFDGEIISTVKCLTCQHLSHTRETFQDISLSIPSVEQLELMRESMAELELNNEETVEEQIKQYQIANDDGYTKWVFNMAYRVLISPIMNTLSYFYRYFFTGSISLEDCLKAFFTADQLKGDDMYSCDKCTKLRNGIKQCKLTRLPEILCVHLKRFRHDNMYHSKIGTRVTFPLCDLDMRSFLDRRLQDDNNLSTEYDLVALISHRGSGLDYGHYVAYCRNDNDKNWYEYDDSFVTKACNEEVLSREAYVLFYQKKISLRMDKAKEIVKDLLRKPEPRMKDTDRFFISRDWLHKFFSFSEPGPISNFDFLCPHGQLSPLFVPSVQEHVVTISARAWDFLHNTCNGGPTLQMLNECCTCRSELIEAKQRKLYERKMFETLQKNSRYSAMPPNVISKTWFEKWEEYVNDIEKEPPPLISNESLVITTPDGSVKLRTSSNFRTIGYESYHFFHSIYGGGPEVFCIPFSNQPSQREVEEMIREIEEREMESKLKPIIKEPEEEEENYSSSPTKMLRIRESVEAQV